MPDKSKELMMYLEDQLVTEEARALEKRLEAGEHQSELKENRAFLQRLRERDPRADQVDVVDAVLARAKTPRTFGRRSWRLWILPAVALAGLLAVIVIPIGAPEAPEFRAKSGGVESALRWTGIHVYKLDAQNELQPLKSLAEPDLVQKNSRLVFSYTNKSPQPDSHLMIYGVDSQGAVHWYYPAWTDALSDPAAIKIRRGVISELLPDRVEQPLAKGPLSLHGLFLNRPLTVQTVEEYLQKSNKRTLSIEGGVDVLLTVEVR